MANDEQTPDPAQQRAPTSGDEGSRAEELQTPSPAGGPGVTPGGTSGQGGADTSVFEDEGEGDGGDVDLEHRRERLQHTDEDTLPPST